MNKKNIFVWSLYDFANSFVFITFLLYFSKWLVVNQGLSDWWYNGTYVLGSIGLIFFAPYLGSRADLFNRGNHYLILSTWGCFLFYALAILAAIYKFNILWPALFFGLGNFFYQLSFVFYNPLLNNIASRQNQGKISGIGFFANYLGQIAAILLALPFVSGKVSLGIDPLIAGVIPAIIIFILLSIPLMISREIFKPATPMVLPEKKYGQLQLFREAILIPGVFYFLLSFFLFSDALTTLINNFSIFTASIFAASNTQISILTLLILISASIGAVIWGWLSDRIGAGKILIINLISYIILIPALAWSINYTFYSAIAIVSGISIGGTWAVSRRLLIELVPAEKLNHLFGLYAISERASTIAGPLVWSTVLAASNYRYAMTSLVIFQILSVILMLRISNYPSNQQKLIWK